MTVGERPNDSKHNGSHGALRGAAHDPSGGASGDGLDGAFRGAPFGFWEAGALAPAFRPRDVAAIVQRVREPAFILRDARGDRDGAAAVGIALGGRLVSGDGVTRAPSAPPTPAPAPGRYPVLGLLPPLYPEWLGDRAFTEAHGLRFPYVAGEMANGIATTRMVIAMARAGMLGFFGAAGLAKDRVAAAVDELDAALGDRLPWGVNLIHSPSEPALEDAVADLLIRRRVVRISVSAFMSLTPAVVRCAAAGLTRDAAGRVRRRHHLFAKLSRPEIAALFMAPAPRAILDALVARRELGPEEAALAARVPVASDVTVEADSGGHTDNRPLGALLPAVLALRDRLCAQHEYPEPVRVGAAGGLGAPGAVAAAFAMGAAYVVTGSVNQAAVESGLSDEGKRMLADADLGDCMMAPAADMFELGVDLQVLKRGTMFGVRARKLREVYRAYPSLDAIPPAARAELEADVLHARLDDIWAETEAFWRERDPGELARAARDGKHRLALAMRWYLGRSSRWAIDGESARRADFQIWCGPAMGAFNAWTRGSVLADPARRTVAQIARNLLEGAAVVTRAQQARSHGVPVPARAFNFAPRLFE